MVVSGIGEWARRVWELRIRIWLGDLFRRHGPRYGRRRDCRTGHGRSRSSGSRPRRRALTDQTRPIRSNARWAKQVHAAYGWNILNEVGRKKVSVTDKIMGISEKT